MPISSSRPRTLRFERSDVDNKLVPRILLADDSPDAKARAKDIAERGEAVIDVATCTEDVIRLAAEHEYSVMIVDRAMVGEKLATTLARLAPRGNIATVTPSR